MVSILKSATVILVSCVCITNSLADEALAIISKKNKDEASVFIEKSQHGIYFQYKKLGWQDCREGQTLELVSEINVENDPFAQADFIDLDNDGNWEVEVTGSCGNKVCSKTIYKLNVKTNRYEKYFEGAYNSISLFDDYLLEAGASGCCSFEFHAYKIPAEGRPILQPPYIVVTVNSTGDSLSEAGNCEFSDSLGKKTDPPNIHWLDLCTVYSANPTWRKGNIPPNDEH